MRLIVAAGVVLLALTGCAPNTDAAFTECVDTQVGTWRIANPAATVEQFADYAALVAEECSAAAEADPQGFIDTWTR
jgi:hypothetical protein